MPAFRAILLVFRAVFRLSFDIRHCFDTGFLDKHSLDQHILKHTVTMKFPTSFLTKALLIGSSLAAPPRGLTERIQTRSAARGSSHQSQPMQRLLTNPEHKELANSVQYSSNWAGAIYESQPEEGPFYAVAGTFTVPEPKTVGEAGGDGVTVGSAWVGIDGDTYGEAILQAGVDFYIQPNGSTFYDAWYEWFPDYAYYFEMDVIAGDAISIYVETYSPVKATCTSRTNPPAKQQARSSKRPPRRPFWPARTQGGSSRISSLAGSWLIWLILGL